MLEDTKKEADDIKAFDDKTMKDPQQQLQGKASRI